MPLQQTIETHASLAVATRSADLKKGDVQLSGIHVRSPKVRKMIKM